MSYIVTKIVTTLVKKLQKYYLLVDTSDVKSLLTSTPVLKLDVSYLNILLIRIG